MTILEARRGRQARKARSSKQKLVRYKRSSPWVCLPPRSANIQPRSATPQIAMGNTMPDGSTGPRELVEVDDITYRFMQTAVVDLLRDRTGLPCTLLNAVVALKSSREISNHFSNDHMPTMGDFWRRIFPGQHQSSKRMRQYQFVRALDDLETDIRANEIVHSWKDVEEVCRLFFTFPPVTKDPDTGDVETDDSVGRFTRQLKAVEVGEADAKLENSLKLLRQISLVPRPVEVLDKADQALADQHIEASQSRAQRLLGPRVRAVEERFLAEERAAEAQKKATSLLREMTNAEKEMVKEAMYGIGQQDEELQRQDFDIVTRKSMWSLRPGQWLNDEIISFFLIMLAKRDEELCKQSPSRKRSLFFNSFFMTKLLNVGHSDSSLDGTYQYKNVKRWSKKAPGKDLFNLDKVIFPINENGMHWVCAVAFMQEKRIQFYDSFGDGGTHYLEQIFRYLKDEHQDKKKSPLPNEDEWRLIPCQKGTPRQLNGFDCGVFTCMFADFVSNDCPLMFSQEHINQCRERIALSILQGSAIM